MKHKLIAPFWIVVAIGAAFLLTSCERPVEQPVVPTLVPTTAPPEPTAPPAPTEDPNAIVEVTPEATALVEATPAAPEASTESQTYVVQAGDTLGEIAQKFGVSVSSIMAVNDIQNQNLIYPGQELTIPPAGTTPATPEGGSTPEGGQGGNQQQPEGGQGQAQGNIYIVSRGENLFRIGLKYGCTVDQMARHNGIRPPYFIYPGQSIKIPPQC